MIAVWWYYLTSLVLLGCFTITLFRLTEVRRNLRQAEERRDYWRGRAIHFRAEGEALENRLEATEAGSADLVTALLPLLEKTDWMTGRWGGQFNTLVRLENTRNTHVEALRRAVSRLPAVAEMNPFEVLKGAAPMAWKSLQTETGVPEDQKVEFAREGGVKRVSRPTQHIAPANSSDFGDDDWGWS